MLRTSALLLALILVPSIPAVHAHDGGVLYDPAAHLGLFPTHDDVQAAITQAASNPWVKVHDLGASETGRAVRVLEITNPDSTIPRAERVVTLLMTQQHGNEPAGTGAALPLLADLLAHKKTANLLDDQVLLLLPMANPDGATANTRENTNGVDINRDHVALATSEARALHKVLADFDIQVAIDHHEYSGTGLGNPVPARTYDFDLTLMYPNNGQVREPTAKLAKSLDYDVLWPAAQAAGYSVGDYGVTTVAGIPVPEVQGVDATARVGGPDPGILRNSFGLNNIVGLLAETFISPEPDNPFQSADRRIAIHRLVMETTLEWAHDHAKELVAAKHESERLNREQPLPAYTEGSATGPLPAAFLVKQDVAGLFANHGLDAGVATAEGTIYNTAVARGGLVAAILHPQSSRHVADASPAAAVPATVPQTIGSNGASVGPVVLAALAAALLLTRRRSA